MTEQHKKVMRYFESEWSRLFSFVEHPTKHYHGHYIDDARILRFVRKMERFKDGGKVLDVGCGRGRQALWFATEGYETYGIDFSESAIQFAKKDAVEAGVSGRAVFLVADVLWLPFEDYFFSVVIDNGCFHHIAPEDRMQYVLSITRVLRSGGIFRLMVFSKRQETTEFLYILERSTIEGLFKKNFRIISVRELPHQQTSSVFIFVFEKL